MKGMTLGEGIKLTKKMFSEMVMDEGCYDDTVYSIIATVQSDRILPKGYQKTLNKKMTNEGAVALEKILLAMCEVGFVKYMRSQMNKKLK